jgi:prepilin-type N-terminal cleavage/methylation domain-containing protein
MMRASHQGSSGGFTLIELLVVVAIIGLLSSVVVVSLDTSRARAREAARIVGMDELVKALELYAAANDQTYPKPASSAGSGTCGSVMCPATLATPLEPYLAQIPLDPLYANKPYAQGNGYRYCGVRQTSSMTSPVSYYALARWSEPLGSYCRPRVVASPPLDTPTTQTCSFDFASLPAC